MKRIVISVLLGILAVNLLSAAEIDPQDLRPKKGYRKIGKLSKDCTVFLKMAQKGV